MKTLIKLAMAFALALQLTGCTDRFSAEYVLEFPEVPQEWLSLLGEPWWQAEWFDSGGSQMKITLPPGTDLKIVIPVTWTNPVAAWPFWPEHNLIPGFFKPAGALFPLDVFSDRYLKLTWEAGVDAVFYRELAYYASQTINETQNNAKIPANFDWARFRELFKSGVLNEQAEKDPWLVDWRNVAERTFRSNFNRSYIAPQTAEYLCASVPAGIWYGTSPFAQPLIFEEGQETAFPVFPGINVWISSEGILRINGNAWVFTKWEE